MANAVYPIAKQRLLEWAFGVEDKPTGVADLYIVGVTSAYVYSAAHEHIASLAGIVGPETLIENVTLTNGVVDGDDVRMEGMDTDETLDAFVVYAKWDSENLLLVYMDTPTDATIPQVISSELGLISFSANGIFAL